MRTSFFKLIHKHLQDHHHDTEQEVQISKNLKAFAQKTSDQAIGDLNSNYRGLTDVEAANRFSRLWAKRFEAFNNPFIDYATFALMFFLICPSMLGGSYHSLDAAQQLAFAALFQAGWFVESLFSQTLCCFGASI